MTNSQPRTEPLLVPSRADILALKHVSRILRHYWDMLISQHCLSVQFVGINSPPILRSDIGLKMRNKKCEVLMHPSNV